MTYTRTITILFLLSLTALAADVANMSGSWVLNPDRSTWGKKERPLSAEATIEHSEPRYRYSGTVHRKTEQEPDHFQFDGAIDGKDHPIQEDQAKRTMSLTRKGRDTIYGVIKSSDGKVQETVTQTVSKDGKTLIRKIQSTSPDGKKASWTEIYEKRG